jgi:hypothetical protein
MSGNGLEGDLGEIISQFPKLLPLLGQGRSFSLYVSYRKLKISKTFPQNWNNFSLFLPPKPIPECISYV